MLDAGHYKESQKLFRRLFLLHSKIYGSSHLKTLDIQLKVADSLTGGGKWLEAQPILRSVVKQAVQIEGTDGQIAFDAQLKLAVNLGRLEAYDEALELFHEFLDAAKRDLRSVDNAITVIMMWDADIASAQGNSEWARATYELLLSTRLPVGRDEGTKMTRGSCLLRLARINAAEKDWHTAEDYYSQAWKLSKKYRGDQNYETVEALAGLAYVTAVHGDTLEAEKMQESVIESCRSMYEDDNPFVTKQRESFGLILQWGGKLDAAEEQYRYALKAVIQKEGYASESCLTVVGNLARVIRDSGNLNRAQETIREHVANLRPTFGDDQTFNDWVESTMEQMLSVEVERASV